MRAPVPNMVTSRMKWMLVAMVIATLYFSQSAESSRLLQSDETALDRPGRSLLQTCYPGMRISCAYNTQVVCEVGGVSGCSCSTMEACLPEVSGCYLIIDGVASKYCGF